jgi:hypothetical protein
MRITLFLSACFLCLVTSIQAQSGLTAEHSSSSFSIEANASSSLGTATL